MDEGPQLYVNKPKKAQVKQFQQSKGMEASSSSSSTGGSSYGGASKPPESFARRYKFLRPILLTVSLGVGAYLYMNVRTKKKDVVTEEETTSAAAPSPPTSTATPTATTVTEMSALPVAQPLKAPEPIPEEQQRELFKWMLEEKRKIKTNDPEEKKRIDEEKAFLKQFIRAKSIPKI